MGPERKLWHELKRNTPQIIWTRIENTSLLGTPDLLDYNSSGKFFTVELKTTSANKIRFSPHQIAFHVRHPQNTFILVRSLVQRDLKLFQGTQIKQLVACGFRLEACSLGLEACIRRLEAWSLWLVVSVALRGSMFRICDMFYVSRPAASTGPAHVALLRSRTVSTWINNCWPVCPGIARSCIILCIW